MNIGQRICQKVQNQESIDQEIKEIQNIIGQIDAEESPVGAIDLNSKDVYKTMGQYIKTVDEKLYEIQKKYFDPNGLKLQMSINKTDLYDDSYLAVNSQNDASDPVECGSVDDPFAEFESKIYPDLLAALNISPLGLMLGSFWHVCSHGEHEFKIITTNRDT